MKKGLDNSHSRSKDAMAQRILQTIIFFSLRHRVFASLVRQESLVFLVG